MTGTDIVRIGVIGAARVAPYAIVEPAKTVSRARLVAVAARSIERARIFADANGIPLAYGSYAALFEDPDIDLVYIATPPSTHAQIAAAAIEAGKHVLLEKPFAMNATEALMISALANEYGVRAFEAMHAPHHRLFRRVSSILTSGTIGKVRRASAHFSTVIDKRSSEFRWNQMMGGGALMDLGIYPLTFCRRLFGDAFAIRSVTAAFDEGVDSCFRAELVFGKDIDVTISASMTEPSDSYLRIEGDRGHLHVRNPVAPSLGNQLHLQLRSGKSVESAGGASSWTCQLEAICSTLLDAAIFPVADDDPWRSMAAIDRIRDRY